MIRKLGVKFVWLILVALTTIQPLNAQSETCQVLYAKISGTYTGECKNGLANGKGKSIGEDRYVGTFKNGLPDGKGKYVFKNGDIYEGYWKDGCKNGKGKFTFSVNGEKQVLVGYWESDEYVGLTPPDLRYRVISVSGILDYEIEKGDSTIGNHDEILFSIKSAFTDFAPPDLRMESSTGQFFQSGKKFGIRNHFYPLHCEVSYSILVGDIRKHCRFVIEILEEGQYSITLNN